MNRQAGFVLIACGVAVLTLGAIGAAIEGEDGELAGPTAGATGAATGSQTRVTGSVTGTTGTTGTTAGTGVTAPVVETPEEFLPAFSEAFREGDGHFLFERLHPVVIEFFGSRTCRRFANGLVDPSADLAFLSTNEPQRYLWEVDGVTTPVEDVLNVRIRLVSAGGETERDIHLGIVGTELYWFADCGDRA